MRNSFAPLLLLGAFFWTKTIHGYQRGSCSRSCHQNSERLLEFDIPQHKCYCSPGCGRFGDCCYDSEHRSQGRPLLSKSLEMCFLVKGKGHFRAIAKCPEGSCFDVGLPPVTSLLTNLTYANRNCAECHGDSGNLTTWKVNLKCCKGHLKGVSLNECGKQGYKCLFQKTGRRSNCTCWYDMSDKAFLDVGWLDLRPCESGSKFTSMCHFEWEEDSECPSYKDPVFVRHRLYKNIDCANCNYKRSADLEGAVCPFEYYFGNSAVFQNYREKRDTLHFLPKIFTGNGSEILCNLGTNWVPCSMLRRHST